MLSGRQRVAICDIGQRNNACPHCGALLWRGERINLCCSAGKVHLEHVPAPPPLLRELWMADTVMARTFRQRARRLNSALPLASMVTREVRPVDGGFAPSVIIQGRVYHRLGPLHPRNGETPTFAQIYINGPDCEDPAAEAVMWLGHVPLPRGTSEQVRARTLQLMEQLQLLLRDVNPYVQCKISYMPQNFQKKTSISSGWSSVRTPDRLQKIHAGIAEPRGSRRCRS